MHGQKNIKLCCTYVNIDMIQFSKITMNLNGSDRRFCAVIKRNTQNSKRYWHLLTYFTEQSPS